MSVIIEAVDEVQVFINECGTVTILQKSWPDGDATIVFPVDRIDAIISALQALKSS